MYTVEPLERDHYYFKATFSETFPFILLCKQSTGHGPPVFEDHPLLDFQGGLKKWVPLYFAMYLNDREART